MEGGFGRPAVPEGTAEVIYAHLELSHYIDTFRVSADRVRKLVFIIAIFSVVMLTAAWNTMPWSWATIRHEKYQARTQMSDAAITKDTNGHYKTVEAFQELADEDARRRVERILFVDIPGIGVGFDVNDLGNFCGLSYALLSLLLLFSVMREHEHLYLALFKVRRLHALERRDNDGESKANYLYHALAMSQVLMSPPTLAHWKPSRLKTIEAPFLISFFPVFVEGVILANDYVTLPNVKNYGVTSSLLIPQCVFLVLNVALCVMSFRYALDFNHMWSSAFDRINPSYKFVGRRPPMQIFQSGHRTHLQKRIRSQAISDLTLLSPPPRRVSLEQGITLQGGEICNEEIDALCTNLERQALDQGTVVDVHVRSSTLVDKTWHVRADFDVQDSAPPRRTSGWLWVVRWLTWEDRDS